MRWMDWLENKIGYLEIPHLLYGIFAVQSAVFLIAFSRPSVIDLFILDPTAVRAGEYWRLISFIFYPPFSSSVLNLLLFAFIMLFFFMIANALESSWGTFRLNLFVFLGLAGHVAAAFLTGQSVTPMYLQLTLFLAFAHYYPEMVFYVMLILPVKVKWMAWLDGAFLIYSFLFGSWATRLMVLLATANYLVFFGPELWSRIRLQRTVLKRQSDFGKKDRLAEINNPVKKCVQCGQEDADADIRLCTCPKCGTEGRFWCLEHVKVHLRKH